jgi:hypothetical protein
VGVLVTLVVAAPASGADTTADSRGALTSRLAKEWRDPTLAAEIVGGLDAELLTRIEGRVPLVEVASSPFLSYRPDRRPPKAFDSVIAYSFGYRDAPDGTRAPGPVNEALADATAKLLTKRTVPVFAQTEIAQVLAARGVRGVTSIDPVVGPDGQTVYLSTAGVAAQVREKAAAAGVDLGAVSLRPMARPARDEQTLAAIRQVMDPDERIVGRGACWAAVRRPRVPLLVLGRRRYDAVVTDRRLVLVARRRSARRPADVAHAKRFSALVLEEQHRRPTLLQQRIRTDTGTRVVVEWPRRARALGRMVADALAPARPEAVA